jgi:hypothetical protein
MKRYRTALLLFAVLFALGGLATWDEWKTKQEDVEKKTKNRLTDAKIEDVVEVSYASTGAGGEEEGEAPKPQASPLEATLVKKDGVWRMTAPVDTLAEAGSIDSLIKTVLEYTYAKTVTDKKEQWKDFGLEKPSRTITLKFADPAKNPPLTVYVGDKAPVGYNVYLRTSASDTVYLGSQYLLTSSSKTLFDLRDKSVAKIDEAPIKTLVYERKGHPTIELSKADGKYKVVKPQELESDSAEVRDFVEDLNAAKAVAFHDAPGADLQAAFAAPDYKVTWVDEKGASGSLAFAEKDGKVFAAFDASQRVFQLGDDAKAKVRKELVDFRNRRVLGFDVADASEVEIDGALYKNVNGEWFKADEAGKEGAKEAAHVRAFLVDLEFAKTDQFYAPAEVEGKVAKAPENKITVRFKKPELTPVTLELFATEDAPDKFLVRRSGIEIVYRLPKSAFNSMRPSDPAKASDESPDAAELPGDMPEGMPEDMPELNMEGEPAAEAPNG